MTTSQNGWPVQATAGSRNLHKWIIPGTKRHFLLRNGSAGFLLCHFILWYHEKIEKIDVGVWDDWAYAYRPVRGATTGLSNHASGTAVDLNATTYPLGTTWMLSWKMIKIRARLVLYRGCIRWGGDYKYRKDQMHFEINNTLSICEFVARRLMKTKRGRRILDANSNQRAVILS